jgi:hypothetical protein
VLAVSNTASAPLPMERSRSEITAADKVIQSSLSNQSLRF